jgi:hypothetical protein
MLWISALWQICCEMLTGRALLSWRSRRNNAIHRGSLPPREYVLQARRSGAANACPAQSVILQVCHRCHAKHLKHAFGQIVGIVIQRFLNHRIGKIIHVMFADVQLDLFRQMDRRSIAWQIQIPVEKLQERLEDSLAPPVAPLTTMIKSNTPMQLMDYSRSVS